jgi:hypothetical protein
MAVRVDSGLTLLEDLSVSVLSQRRRLAANEKQFSRLGVLKFGFSVSYRLD